MTHAKVPELTDTGCRVVNDSPDGKMLNPEFPLAGGLFTCAFCGQSMTGERICRKLKGGGIREHIYYRCANNSPGPDHPTVRWKSHEREQAIVEDLHQLRLPTPQIAEWFRTTLEESLADLLSHQHRRAATLAKRKSELMAMKDRLLNANLAGTVDDDAFKAKTAELKADTARVTEEIDAQGDVDPARGKAVLAVFDWSQKVAEIWRGSNTAARQQILDSIRLNRQASDATPVTTKRKPFDFFVERLDLKKSREYRTRLELFSCGVRLMSIDINLITQALTSILT